LIVAVYLTAGIGLVGGSLTDRWPWFTSALGLFMLGLAAKWFGTAASLASIRERTGMSVTASLRAMAAFYICAGVLTAIGAFTLDRAFGLIVAFAAGGWSILWGSMLARIRKLAQPTAANVAAKIDAGNRAG